MDPYLLAKWMHILSATVLFGTGIGTAFQMVWAMRSRDARVIHSTASGIVIADWLFTTPAGIIQPATGLWLIWLQGHDLMAPWLLATYLFYALAFCCWVPVVGLQLRIRDLTRNTDKIAPEVFRAYRIWFLLGWPAFAALIAVFWLMVSKPSL